MILKSKQLRLLRTRQSHNCHRDKTSNRRILEKKRQNRQGRSRKL